MGKILSSEKAENVLNLTEWSLRINNHDKRGDRVTAWKTDLLYFGSGLGRCGLIRFKHS